jgi:hypothetical protein
MKTLTLLLSLLTLGSAQTYKPSEANLNARQWFQDSKFGLFIHWGVYSVLGEGEWVMNNKKMTIAEYEPLAARFNPTEFDAAEWVRIAKSAGMKYITITSKHHDGFAMWGTKQTKWNIVDATPYKQDPLKMLAEECRKQGVKLLFYHSELDWHHSDYYPRGRTGHNSRRFQSLPRLHGQSTPRAANQLRRHSWNLVRRLVGQAYRGLAPGENVQLDPQPATSGAGRQQSSSKALRWRRLSDVREGSAGAEYGRFQRAIGNRQAAARILRHDEQVLGI